MDAQVSTLSDEVAGIRLVLVHLLARLTYDDHKAISETTTEGFDRPRPQHGIGGMNEDEAELWGAPYRAAVDRILAQSEGLRAG